MTRRTTARRIDREEADDCIDFDAALEAYLTFADDGAGEDLLRAAAMVLGSTCRWIQNGPRRSPR